MKEDRRQYGLGDLFQFVTICSILCALLPLIGAWRAVLLMLAALAVRARHGEMALVLVGIATLLVPGSPTAMVVGIVVTMTAAAAFGGWYAWIRRQRTSVSVKENIRFGSRGRRQSGGSPFAD